MKAHTKESDCIRAIKALQDYVIKQQKLSKAIADELIRLDRMQKQASKLRWRNSKLYY